MPTLYLVLMADGHGVRWTAKPKANETVVAASRRAPAPKPARGVRPCG